MFRTDQEPSSIELVKHMWRLRPNSRSCTPQSGVGDSKGERIRRAGSRVLRKGYEFSLEKGVGQNVPCGHLVIGWLVEHSADVLNRFQVGADGSTPYHRLKGPLLVGTCWNLGAW